MSSTEDRKKLAQIGKQRTTDGPHNVFDASQFKALIEQDVSSNVIEKLQNEFGKNMAGGRHPERCYSRILANSMVSIAIDRFHEMKQKPSKDTTTEMDPEIEGKEKEKLQKNVEVDNLGRKPFVIRDR